MKNITKVVAFLFLASLTACASSSDVDALKAEVERANATAHQALQTANAAKIEASSASETAQEAKATADTTANKIEYLMKKNQGKKHK